ncbi:filamentous hemagglutinin N-terminal domain-containing protein [Cloacibacillus sp. An23]|uniref:filamentous hemagglutinin N-terminal domain-containing protein n=1 Tax=Cloacibacillus sp. An23 TaxID=1965591 RepID=UPI000B36A05D|nr:filamentous hemagglutinin N-terminal domain-containing protein [Cloacibacillus sp. An23]OUO91374.1 hypothetical protein B5F39_13095 [Cloacibacillus sp. An23]
MIKRKQKLKRVIAFAVLLCFTSLTGAQPLYAIPANTQLPTGPGGVVGQPEIFAGQIEQAINGNTLTLTQTGDTSVLKWGDFSIGADAAVSFVGANGQNFNDLNSVNFVNSGAVSEIYGQLTALGGNIFIANPAGVQIGNSAQINVGSLYVTNKDITSAIDNIRGMTDPADIRRELAGLNTSTNAELMSLGSIISANNVTFDGGRIVLDTDRLYKNSEREALEASKLQIRTTDASNVVLGYTYDGYNDTTGYEEATEKKFDITVNGTETSTNGYMWVEDLFQLQNMNTNLGGWYALRNSIDASFTASDAYQSGFDGNNTGLGFKPIGIYDGNQSNSHPFYGRFDGLGYDIFGLTIKRPSENYVGLFGYVANDSDERAYVRNFTLNSGSINGRVGVGGAFGMAGDGTVIENIVNTADVTGVLNVGGIIGTISGTAVPDADLTELNNLINIGTVSGGNSVGGIAGYISYASIGGETYNLGNIRGIESSIYSGYNIGGIVGRASNASIGNESGFQIYNQASVTGAYNVGGIVGYLQANTIGNSGVTGSSEVRNVANHGAITATGSDTDTYRYHTGETTDGYIPSGGEFDENSSDNDKLVTVTVAAANAGGIVGASQNARNAKGQNITIKNVLNDGDVTTETRGAGDEEYYISGNVGGIVGSAQNTKIENATNRENNIRGAHNVGGIAGLLYNSSVKYGENDGGDIMATGARDAEGNVVKERVRKVGKDASEEDFIIGNIGGIAGYMYDDVATDAKSTATTFISDSTNRGTVHSQLLDENQVSNPNLIPDTAKAANVGGIAGRVDMRVTQEMADVRPDDTGSASTPEDYMNVTIRHSYNTGDVQGYTGVGGVAGMMYNGSIARSFNMGDITTTRRAGANLEPLNMGGIVGDTTVWTNAQTMIYDVYNAGQIGDETFNLYGRHVGGIVGRLNGDVEKAYNTGDIFNGATTVGGVAGWWFDGDMTNVFNTGNITVRTADEVQVGGIAGAASENGLQVLNNAYNLGTIRAFQDKNDDGDFNPTLVGGIIGRVRGGFGYNNGTGKFNDDGTVINNVYTLGNIYSARADGKGGYNSTSIGLGAIYGMGNDRKDDGTYTYDQNKIKDFTPWFTNANYIKPETGMMGDTDGMFRDLSDGNNRLENQYQELHVNAIDYDDKSDAASYSFKNAISKIDTSDFDAKITGEWRLYDGTPILNVFLPYAEEYFSKNSEEMENYGIQSIQYGTAYNPLMTIVTFDDNAAEKNLTLDWGELGITGTAGLAVYNGNLTLNNFQNNGDHYFGGTIYAGGGLTVNAATGEGFDGTTFVITDDAKLYGSSVTVNTGGRDALISGSVTATGEHGGGNVVIDTGDGADGKAEADIEILGSISSAQAKDTEVQISGISGKENNAWLGNDEEGNEIDWTLLINNPLYSAMPQYSDLYSHIATSAIDDEDSKNGTVGITTGGSVSILLGNMGMGQINSYNDFSVEADDGIYLAAPLNITQGDINLTSSGEMVADFSTEGFASHLTGGFLENFGKNSETNQQINVSGGGDVKIMVDMWVEDDAIHHDGHFDFSKYDGNGTTLKQALDDINVVLDKQDYDGAEAEFDASKYVYVWLSDAYQLKGMQEFIDNNNNSDEDKNAFLGYNFALKNDIDASVINGYEAIGTGTDGFSGVFDGRGFRILGLNVGSADERQTNAGIFDTINGGTVRDLRVYASNFYGTSTAGAIAGVNKGTITNVTTIGNHVEASGGDDVLATVGGTENIYGAAGGIAGVNDNGGTISGSNASDVVIAAGTTDGRQVTAGGIAGINADGGVIGKALEDDDTLDTAGADAYLVTADSAVTASSSNTYSLGGAIGVNMSDAQATLVNSSGVTNGRNGMDAFNVSANVGGVVGVNEGKMVSLYNESIVMAHSNVGGVAGTNNGSITNAVNATSVTSTSDSDGEAAENTGGIAGVNTGTITSGRNAGEVEGVKYVGGMVGSNRKKDDDTGGELQNLSNAIAATVTGNEYVGGIAGTNAGKIASDNQLTNEGTVTGTRYVGGVAGKNTGTIESTDEENFINRATVSGLTYVGGIAGENAEGATITNVTNQTFVLKANESGTAQYFGGIAGTNSGTITNATNENDVTAKGAQYVGGIVGENTGSGTLVGVLTNNGNVTGGSNVGGLAGINKNETLLQGKRNDDGTITRLEVTNTGDVEGTDGTRGSAGGIFYANTGNIWQADLVNMGTVKGNGDYPTGGLFGTNSGAIIDSTLTNSGAVQGNGTTGGLIGENTGAIENSVLTNKTAVTGGDNTGGLIGTNSGDVKNSSLMNEYGATVTGDNNTGGLIGNNTGKIIGGRGTADNGMEYYADKIYNNGTVNGADNTGGLVGNNAAGGSLEAGYNTGVVTGTNNVGGIAGTNAGTIDQVFNTVMTADATAGTQKVTEEIRGTSNVGGLVGSNSGELTNAYNNTTKVTAENGTKGNAVGENSGKIENIYATNDSGNLIGDNNAAENAITNAYSFAVGDDSATKVITGDEQKQRGSYDGFGDVWKFYDGYNTPLLKVFLTEAKYDGENPGFVYNGQDQGLDVNNVLTADGSLNSLLEALKWKNVGQGYLAFGLTQIAATTDDGVFNPNNLGYDIDVHFDIAKAQLNITLDDISRVYGNKTITNNTAAEDGEYHVTNNDGYGFVYGVANGDKELTSEMIAELNGTNGLTFAQTADGAVDNLVPGKTTTNNVDEYEWSASFSLGALSQNYEFVDSASSITVSDGKSTVGKAELHVTLADATHTYGNAAVTNNGGKYTIESGLNLVNGDKDRYGVNDFDVTMTGDGALTGNETGRVTYNAGGDYKWSGTVAGSRGTDINTNYNIIVDGPGQSVVNKADLHVTLDTAERTYGDAALTNNGGKYAIKDDFVLANGDQYGVDDFAVSMTDDGALTGNVTGKVTNDAGGAYMWNGTVSGGDGTDIDRNYNIIVDGPADSVVNKANLTIALGDVERTYGDTTIRDGAYGIAANGVTGLTNGDENGTLGYAGGYETDGSTVIVNGDERTNDVREGGYTWTVAEGSYGSAFTGVDGLTNNYNITVVAGKSTVTPKKVSVSGADAEIVYGNQGGAGFTLTPGSGAVNGLVYGDEVGLNADLSSVGSVNLTGDYEANRDGRVTADVGHYKDNLVFEGLTLTGGKAGNYELENDSVLGGITVTPARLEIAADDQSVVLGTLPVYTGTAPEALGQMLVNGDVLSGFGYEFGLSDALLAGVVGTHPGAIGVIVGGEFYGGGVYDWSRLNGVFANYDVYIVPGSLTVSPLGNYGYIHSDGWDRVRNFRERKAELYFHEGGMEYAENM